MFQGLDASAGTNSTFILESTGLPPFPDRRETVTDVGRARLTIHVKPFTARIAEPNSSNFNFLVRMNSQNREERALGAP